MFAEVAVDVAEVEGQELVVNAEAVDHGWRAAATVGVRYAHEQWMQGAPGRMTAITVTAVTESPVDTSQLTVLFAAYQATCRALGIAADDRALLREDWVFEFPSTPGK